jgi:hypothetical protein
MSLLETIKNNHKDLKALNKVSLDAIRVVVEACNCPKDGLCDSCKDLLEYYRWKKVERQKYLGNACDWLIHQIMTIFYGSQYKEQGFHFSRDIYTLKEVVELYEDYLEAKDEKEKKT